MAGCPCPTCGQPMNAPRVPLEALLDLRFESVEITGREVCSLIAIHLCVIDLGVIDLGIRERYSEILCRGLHILIAATREIDEKDSFWSKFFSYFDCPSECMCSFNCRDDSFSSAQQ